MSSPVAIAPHPADLNAAAALSQQRRTHHIAIGLVTAAFLSLYAPVLARLAEQWWSDPNYAYGFLVPLFCAWLVYERRGRLRRMTAEPAASGWILVIAALGLLLLGKLGSELLLTRLSLLLMLAGAVVTLRGWPWLRALAFPLVFLGFMIPWPTLIYNLATIPLKNIATRSGVGLLGWTGLPILREGNLILLPNATLDVIAACSGIRSLLALLALATAYGYLLEPVWGRRLLLIAAMPPLAVLSNAVRIALTILLTFRFGDAASHGIWHMLTGLQVFAVALIGLVVLQRALRAWPTQRGRHA